VKRIGIIVFLIGSGAMAALIVFAGAGLVGRALLALGAGGLAVIVLLHIPVIALLGEAWWSIGRDTENGSRLKFVWARLVRDAAAEFLPFSQLGGYVIGIRALTVAGAATLPAAVSMIVDLIVEFAAKLPYLAAGLLLLFWQVPDAGLLRPMAIGAAAAALAFALIFIFRRPINSVLERAAIAMAARWRIPGLPGGDQIRPAFDRAFAKDGRMLFGFAVHLICWVVGAAEAWVAFSFMDVQIGFREAFVIDSLASTLRTFGFAVPAAAGVQEAAYVLVAALFGIGAAEAIAFSLARRARDLVIGVVGLSAWQLAEGRRAFAGDR
jgi:putative membrane protein